MDCDGTGYTPCKDVSTEIVWSRDINTSNDYVDYSDVAKACRESLNGGISQWRAPTIDEIRTILPNNEVLFTGGDCTVSDECYMISSEECYDSEVCNTGEPFESLFHDYTFIVSGTPTEEWNGEELPASWKVNFAEGSISSHNGEYLYVTPVIRCVKDESITVAEFPYTDSESGLVWSSLSTGVLSWEDAETYCEELSEGGYDTWALPTIEELMTLVINCYEDACEPSITGIYSAIGDVSTLWSSTVDNNDTISYNVFDFMTASQTTLSSNDAQYYYTKVRCVISEFQEGTY